MNTVNISGRLGKEVEETKTETGISTCKFSIAVNKGYGENKKTHWIECVAWRSTADYLFNYARKGDLLEITGELTTNNYKNKNGENVYRTYVTCNKVELYSNKPKQESEYKKQENATDDLEEIWNQPSLNSELDNPDDSPFFL